jgi:hypothetical protein
LQHAEEIKVEDWDKRQALSFIRDLLNTFPLSTDAISTILPRNFMTILGKRLAVVVMGQEEEQEFQEAQVKRTFGVFLNSLSENRSRQDLEKSERADDFVILFLAQAFTFLQRTQLPGDSGFNLLRADIKQVALFVRLMKLTLRDNGWEVHKSELVTRLSTFEQELLRWELKLEHDVKPRAKALYVQVDYAGDDRDQSGRTILVRACQNADLDAVKIHLTRRPQDLNVADKKRNTPLQIATSNGSVEIVKFLLEQNCEMDTRNFDNQTPLESAFDHQHLEIVKLLLTHGAGTLSRRMLETLEMRDSAFLEDMREEIREEIRESEATEAQLQMARQAWELEFSPPGFPETDDIDFDTDLACKLLAPISEEFYYNWAPSCFKFVHKPPREPKILYKEHKKLTEIILARIVRKAADVDTHETRQAGLIKTKIVTDAREAIRRCDEVSSKDADKRKENVRYDPGRMAAYDPREREREHESRQRSRSFADERNHDLGDEDNSRAIGGVIPDGEARPELPVLVYSGLDVEQHLRSLRELEQRETMLTEKIFKRLEDWNTDIRIGGRTCVSLRQKVLRSQNWPEVLPDDIVAVRARLQFLEKRCSEMEEVAKKLLECERSAYLQREIEASTLAKAFVLWEKTILLDTPAGVRMTNMK